MGALDRVFRNRRGVSRVRPLAAIVAGLWRNGEQGVWYDASDLSTMYQDAAGTLPVYAPGQGQVDPPVGLWLDKRLPIGNELVLNGDNESSVAVVPEDVLIRLSKTRTADFAQSGAFSTKLTSTAGSGTHYWQLWKVPANKSVLVTGFIYIPDGAAARQPIRVVDQSDGSVIVDVAPAASTDRWVSFRYYRAPKGAQWIMSLGNNTPADWGTTSIYVDNLSIRELPGNHAYQTTTTSRPTLSARYNICTSTENVAAWTKVNGDTGAVPVITPDAGLAPDGTMTADRCVMERGSGNTAAAFSLVYTGGTFPTAAQATRSIWLKSYSGAVQSVLLYDGSQAVGRVVSVTADWQQFFLTGGTAATGTSLVIGTRGGDSRTYYASGGQQSLDLLVWGIDIRAANDGVGLPAYQRVVDANTYDTVGFPLYLRFDGVDDFLQTANVDFSGTDVVAIATAYRKMSDVSVGEVFALSGNPTASSGTFGFYTPESANGTAAAVFFARGASSIISGQRLGAAPISCVAGGWVSISMPYMRYRINQGSSLTSSAATGGGNFGNYPLYIGRRSGTSFPFNGRLYSLIIRGTATPDATIAQVERHLNQKARVY